MQFPEPLRDKFEFIGPLPGGKIIQCFRVKGMSRDARECVCRLLPEPFCQDRLIVERFHDFFTRFAQIPNRTHLASVYSISGVAGGAVYILEEFVSGIALPAFAERKRNIRGFVRDVTEVLVKTCEALHHAHQKDILHLCISPQDILVDEATGKVRLVGFGAQIFVQAGRLGSLSEKRKKYLAPEVLSGNKFNPCSDIYSLAAAATDGVPKLIEYGDILKRAVSENPMQRYQRARDFQEKLREAGRRLQDEPHSEPVHTEEQAGGGLQPVLNIITEPAGAAVKVNGIFVGTTNHSGLAVTWKPGIVIVIEKAGYEAQSLKFASILEKTDLNIKLVSILNLVTNPWGASVKVKGQLIGISAREGLRVPWDQGEIVVEKKGYKTETVTFGPHPPEPEIMVELILEATNPVKIPWKAMVGASVVLLFVGILAGHLFTRSSADSGTASISVKDTEIGRLKDELQILTQRVGEISALKQTIVRKDSDIDQLKATVHEQRQRIAELGLRVGTPQGDVSSGTGLKIISVNIPSSVQSGETFSVRVEAENGGQESDGGITVSSPDPSGLTLISADPGRLYDPGSLVVSVARDNIWTTVPMAEHWIKGWGKNERHHLNVEIEAGHPGAYPLYVRCALKVNVGGGIRMEPSASDVVDQQGFPVKVYNVTVK
jgi:hypothetical protein